MSRFFNKPVEHQQEKIDYSKLSNDELLDQFKTENWNKIDTSQQKINLLQEVENRHATANGRMPAQVREINDPSLLGSYQPYTHTISIRLDNNPYENLDSVIHEGQHANQQYSHYNISSHDKNMIRIESMSSPDEKQSFYSYYQDANGNDLYNIYSSELNSNNRALAFVTSQNNRYQSDDNYKEYIKGRNEHYNQIAYELNNHLDDKKAAIKETVQTNYDRGLVSWKYNESMQNYVDSHEHVDSYEEEAISYHESLNEVVQSYQNDLSNEQSNNLSVMTSMEQENEESQDYDYEM